MKCQSCHFISSNYRLACRPFNDHLQRCLQCIRGSTKSSLSLCGFTLSKNTHARALAQTRLHYHELPQTPISTQTQAHVPLFSPQTPSLLVYLRRAKQELIEPPSLSRPANQKAEWNICNHNSSVPFNYGRAHLKPSPPRPL